MEWYAKEMFFGLKLELFDLEYNNYIENFPEDLSITEWNLSSKPEKPYYYPSASIYLAIDETFDIIKAGFFIIKFNKYDIKFEFTLETIHLIKPLLDKYFK